MATMIDGESYVGRVLIRRCPNQATSACISALAVPEEPNGGPHLRHRGQRGRKFSVLMRTGHAGIGTRAAMTNLGRRLAPRFPRGCGDRRPSSPGPWRTCVRTPRSSWRTRAIGRGRIVGPALLASA